MSQAARPLRAPVLHRLVVAIAWPIAAFFVARLFIRLTPVPDIVAYVVCVGVGLLAGFRAFSAQVKLLGDELLVRNSLATARVPRADIKRIGEGGRIEWHRDSPRAIRLPAEALYHPRWTLGTGAATYAANREAAREWLRAARRRAGEQESYTDVLPVIRPTQSHRTPAPHRAPGPHRTPAPHRPAAANRTPAPPAQRAPHEQPRLAQPAGHPEGLGPKSTANHWTDPLAPVDRLDHLDHLDHLEPVEDHEDAGHRAAREHADEWLKRWDAEHPNNDWRRNQ